MPVLLSAFWEGKMNPLEQFLRQAAQEIRAMPAAVRADELRELRGHLEQRAQDYIGAGMSASEAQTRAVAGLGSARALGTKLCDVWEGVPFRWWRLLAAITGAISLQLMWSLLNFFTAYVHQTAYGNQEEPTLTATRNLWNTLSPDASSSCVCQRLVVFVLAGAARTIVGRALFLLLVFCGRPTWHPVDFNL